VDIREKLSPTVIDVTALLLNIKIKEAKITVL
jgi:hypothetical protein